MHYFRGKRAVITGAGSGIGRALALRLAAEGCELHLSDIDGSGLAGTTDMLPAETLFHTALVDVADAAAVDDWSAAIAAQAEHVDLLVNNAGVGLIGDAADTSLEDFHWLMNINFWGVVHGCRFFLPLLDAAPRGHLVNVSSIFGIAGVPTQSAYNASKFAVRGYSEALRQELALAGSRITLCCVHPGGIDTNIARRARNSDRDARPEEQHASFAPMIRNSPDAAARKILDATQRGKARLLVGADACVLDWLCRLFPTAYASLLRPRIAGMKPQ